MKVIFFINSITGGGAERVTVAIANELSNRDFDIAIACNTKITPVYPISEKVKFINSFTFPPCRKLIFRINLFKSIRKILKKEKPDIAVGVMEFYAFWVKMASFGLKNKVIASDHSSFERPKEYPLTKVQKFGKFHFYKYMDAVTVLTNADANCIKHKMNNTHVMPNPLFFPIYRGIENRKNYIVAAGRLDSWYYKGFDLLIKAWAMIASDNLDWKLIIAGVGDDKSLTFLKNLTIEYSVQDRIKFTGFISNIDELFQQSKIFVLSSRNEGFPMVLCEAMSQGCACIACDNIGRTKEIITSSDSGIIYETMNIQAMASAIQELIDNPQRIEQMSGNARKEVFILSIDKIGDKWQNLFKKLLHNE